MGPRDTTHPPQSLLHRLVTVECKLLQETDRELRVTLNGDNVVLIPLIACQIVRRNHHDIIVVSIACDIALRLGLTNA